MNIYNDESEASYEYRTTLGELAEEEMDEELFGGENSHSYAYHADVLHDLTIAKVKAQNAKTGETIKCAQCGKRMVKNHHSKVFCSNQRTHGKRNCKDKYHNRVKGLKFALDLIRTKHQA